MNLTRTEFTYRRGVVCWLTQTLAVVGGERSMLVVLVGHTLGLMLGVIVGEKAVRPRARGGLEGVSLGFERACIHGGRDQRGGW